MRPVPQLPATVIPCALVDTEDTAFVQALTGLRLPHLARLLATARVQRSPAHPPQRLSSVHEWAQAQAWGWTAPDGLLPWAAWHARERGLDAHGKQAWAVLTLCHWHVVQGQVSLEPPASLAVSEAETEALRQAMQIYCTQDGITLHPFAPGQWLAASELFRQLPSASVDRAVGQSVQAWWVGTGQSTPSAAAQHLRRLQNEMQMLFYTHPCNETRAMPINSFWVSGTGDLAAASATAPDTAIQPPGQSAALAQALLVGTAQPAWLHPAVQRLQQAAQQRHVPAWVDAWHAVDAQVLASLDAAQSPALVLCGARQSSVVQCQPKGWQTWWRTWRAPALTQALLEQ